MLQELGRLVSWGSHSSKNESKNGASASKGCWSMISKRGIGCEVRIQSYTKNREVLAKDLAEGLKNGRFHICGVCRGFSVVPFALRVATGTRLRLDAFRDRRGTAEGRAGAAWRLADFSAVV